MPKFHAKSLYDALALLNKYEADAANFIPPAALRGYLLPSFFGLTSSSVVKPKRRSILTFDSVGHGLVKTV